MSGDLVVSVERLENKSSDGSVLLTVRVFPNGVSRFGWNDVISSSYLKSDDRFEQLRKRGMPTIISISNIPPRIGCSNERLIDWGYSNESSI